VDITFTVTTENPGQIINEAEISSAEAPAGFNNTDVDSVADTDQNNDAGGEVNLASDDEINQGCCSPAGTGDEDDADPEDITVEVFDLALIKTLSVGSDARVYPGETVTFDIEVFNQGTVEARNIEVTDYVPAGLTVVGSSILDFGTLEAEESRVLQIEFTVDAATSAGSLINRAEISDYTDDLGEMPTDIDSVADDNDGNDDEVNDVIDNSGGDEDDADLEQLELEIFDLALTKELAGGEDARVYPGEDVTFTITVTNEGSVEARNIEVTDYLPSCLSLNDGNWSLAGGFAVTTINGPISPNGGTATVDITVTVGEDCVGVDVVNVAEISQAEDVFGDQPEDNDSDLDNDPNNPDDDDADDEPLDPQLFDLALIKTLGAGEEDNRVYPGETVTFDIEVINQGTVPASNIVVEDFTPEGLTANGSSTINIPGTIQPGGSEIVSVEFTVNANASAGNTTNIAEIQSGQDDLGDNPEDIDSTPDNDPNNDPTVDNETENGGGDEDDNDIEDLDIQIFDQIFDLALRKTLSAGEDRRVFPGETVSFDITVFNQGTVDATNVQVTDYVPAGLTPVGSSVLDFGTITVAQGSKVLQVEFTVDAATISDAGILTNRAEISDYADDLGGMPDDIDSVADDNDGNDGAEDNDSILNENGDEDDADFEELDLEIFDLASNITLNAGEDDNFQTWVLLHLMLLQQVVWICVYLNLQLIQMLLKLLS